MGPQRVNDGGWRPEALGQLHEKMDGQHLRNKGRVEEVREEVQFLRDELHRNYTRADVLEEKFKHIEERYGPVKSRVDGLVTLIVVAVISALVMLVVRR